MDRPLHPGFQALTRHVSGVRAWNPEFLGLQSKAHTRSRNKRIRDESNDTRQVGRYRKRGLHALARVDFEHQLKVRIDFFGVAR